MITTASLGQYLLDHREHPDRLLPRIATCTDIVQLHDAHTVARLFGLKAEIIAALDDKISRLTGIRATEQAVSLSAVGDGAADEYVRDAMMRLKARCEAKDIDEGEATVTFKLGLLYRAGAFVITVPQPDVKLPALRAKSSLIRLSTSTDGDVLVMDRAEDSDGNRQLPLNLQ